MPPAEPFSQPFARRNEQQCRAGGAAHSETELDEHSAKTAENDAGISAEAAGANGQWLTRQLETAGRILMAKQAAPAAEYAAQYSVTFGAQDSRQAAGQQADDGNDKQCWYQQIFRSVTRQADTTRRVHYLGRNRLPMVVCSCFLISE